MHTLRFEPLFVGRGVTENVRCSLWAYWKTCSEFLLVLIELFALCVTAKALRANIGSKSAISLQRGRCTRNFK